jgi:glycosyltransferase involved in cell wall biosynthesis
MDKAPSAEERLACKKQLCSKYGISPEAHILLFNGTLDYKPNRDALDIILEKINPVLLANPQFPYRIIICGSKLPASYHALQAYTDKNIIYAGFVDDISVFFKGADIFINPVTDGGGIKTKVVEALGYDMAVVSTQSGAIGIPSDITGNKLRIVADTNPEAFAKEVMSLQTGSAIPPEYFEHFYWGNIASKAAKLISSIP